MAVKVPVALGGTGADNAADARANLGVSGNTAGGVYSGISISNAQITSSNVSGNVTVLTGNVMLTKSGANVTFEAPGSTVVGAQFKTPGIHDLSTQRIVTVRSNNYSGNRAGDYKLPTLNIKAKYNNVSINTAGRIIYSNRFDDELAMPIPSKFEGFISYNRDPGAPGEVLVSNALQRHKILIANADVTPGVNITYSIGTAASQWTFLRVANDVIAGSNVDAVGGMAIGGDSLIVNQHSGNIGMGTSDPEHEVDIRANVYISGNLTVKGNTYIVNTQHLIVDDPVIELGANVTGTPTLDEGILMNRGSLSNAFLGYDESRDEMVVAYTSDPSSVTTITIDGYTPFRANSTVLAVEGDGGGTNDFSKVAIGTASPGSYKLDVHGNANVGALTATSISFDSALAVGSGGTGATSFTDGGVLLGSGTSALTATPVLTDGVMLVGDGTTDPALEGNTTLRTSIGVGTGNTPQFYGANVTGNASINRSLAVGYTDGRVPQANLDVRNNVYIGGATTITGKLSATSVTPAFYGANVTGNASVTRSLAVGYTDGRVPQANLDVKGNVYIGNDVFFSGANYDLLWDETTSKLKFYDSTQACFGDANDLQIYHGGTHSFIKNSTGQLRIKGDDVRFRNKQDLVDYIRLDNSGGHSNVRIYHNDAEKLVTTGTGITVSGIGANVTGNVSVTRSLAIGWTDGRVPQANLEVIGNANVGILTATSLRVNGTAISTTSTFTGLTDTPSSYSGQAGKLTAVNSAANALEFIDDNAIVMAIALG